MKGRSHRLQSHDQHDDWLDGSWTVDCICGVTFDDGEEMVNCDECGVWVHTRCSRYVKGDDLFACDKCKAKNNLYNDNEETEVAQLLVELPTKTIRLDSSCGNGPPPRRPLRLWTDMPLEEKVHVQGIPGGDSALFRGLSSVFTPELWKSSGYVPKKFNFQYREFPCWDKEEDNENNVDKGAGVLFSLSKESMFTAPREEKIVPSKETKKRDLGSGELGGNPQVGLKKKRSLLQPVLIHSGKRKKEDVLMCKDRSGKKKARVSDKELVSKKRGQQTSRTSFPSTSSDARDLHYPRDAGQDTKNEYMKERGSQHCEPGNHVAVRNVDEDSKSDTLLIDHSMGTSYLLKDDLTMEASSKERKISHGVLSSPTSSLKKDNVLPVEPGEAVRNPEPMKQEEDTMLNENPDDEMNSSPASVETKHLVEKDDSAKIEINDNQLGGRSPHTIQTAAMIGVPVDSSIRVTRSPSASGGGKDMVISSDNVPENIKISDIVSAVSTSPSQDKNAEEVVRTDDSEALGKCDKEETLRSKCHAEEVKQLAGDPSKLTRGKCGGSENAARINKSNAELKQSLGSAEGQFKSSKMILSPPTLPSQHKRMVTGGKSLSNSSTDTVSESVAPDHFTSTDGLNATAEAKQPVTSDYSDKKNQTANDGASDRDVGRRSPSRSRSMDRLKTSQNSSSKLSSTSKALHTSASGRVTSDSKDFTNHLLSKVSVAQKPRAASGSLQNEWGSNSQRTPGSGLPLKGENLNHSSSQSASKLSHSPSTNPALPSTSISTLSDEELALLLHQELNSSPRVPRIPRVRQAAQLTSPTAASLLMKHSSSGSGVKDFSSFSRRKAKDVSKDGPRARWLDDEPRRAERRRSSPDRKRQDSASVSDVQPRRDKGGSSMRAQNVKKSTAPVSNSTANSGRSSSTEGNDHQVSSLRKSPTSDEEAEPAGGSVRRTLPSLINEIMSKGKRMTYEELCNAVLPQWPSLRKHNGERYAYSSHSQAVLDCLRNRHEWARLVDRGPKTSSSSRKRRKTDAEESEEDDEEVGKGRNSSSSRRESQEGKKSGVEGGQKEEFPKGKRNVRKRRRLALQGRGIKDARKALGKADQVTDDDDSAALFSNSSEESLLSDGEEEMQGSAAGPFRSEESDSSDKIGTS